MTVIRPTRTSTSPSRGTASTTSNEAHVATTRVRVPGRYIIIYDDVFALRAGQKAGQKMMLPEDLLMSPYICRSTRDLLSCRAYAPRASFYE